jgi:signal transduction histidine kinase/CheY-like chemotaxis protein
MRPRNPLRLAEDRILVEQIRLLAGHAFKSLLPAILVALLLAWTLWTDSNAERLKLWCAAAIAAKLCATFYAHRHRTPAHAAHNPRRTVWVLLVLHAIEGAAWGALAWAALDDASVGGSVLVIASAAGIAGSSMAAFAPVLPIYLAFSTSVMLALSSKLWLMPDPAYRTMATLAVLYVPMLFPQARDSATATRAAIELRFDNLELVRRLREEKRKAQAAHREAEEANLGKSKFLAAASHDLRQPLHAVNLFIEALRHERDPAKAARIVTHLGDSAGALMALLDELLDVSKLEAGVFTPHLRNIGVQALFDSLERDLRPVAEAKGLQLGFVPTRAVVRSDPQMLGRILRNIIINAIRYTESGAVLVGCRRKGGHIAIATCDTGPGIAPEHHEAIFREFYQLGNPGRQGGKGLGLGLAIVDGLGRVLNHRIELCSRVGHGSTFYVHVPFAAGEDDARDPDEEFLVQMDGCAVLVIDDEPAIRRAMSDVLTSWGHRVLAAEDAEQAAAGIARTGFDPDVLIADYRLQDGTGIEAIAQIRERLGRNLPAVLLTGDTDPQRLREATASGLLLLHKPIRPMRLYLALNQLRSGAALADQAT